MTLLTSYFAVINHNLDYESGGGADLYLMK